MSKDELGVQEVSPGYEFIAENPAVPVGYKLTEVGVIPDDWDTKQLNCVCTMKSGESITSKKISDHALYACYGGNGLRGFTDRYTHDGDFALIGRQGALCGNVVRVKGKFFASEHAVVVSPNKGIDIKWLAYVLDTMNLNRFSESSAQPGLSVSKVLLLPLLVPSSQLEQQAIATALSDVDALLEELDRLIAKKRDIKQAAMQQLLTGEIRLPGFEGEWEARRIGDVLEVRHGRSQKEVETKDGEYPIYASGGEIGRANTYLYSKPSVLIGRKGTIDAPRYCDQPFWTVDTLFYTELLDRNSAKFMYYKFCMIPWRNYNEASGVPSLSARTIENIEIVLPTHEEQEAIAAVLSDMDTEIQALEQRRSKTAELKQGMMQELLTGRTRLV
jgi:type I restriction enzyme S subunit